MNKTKTTYGVYGLVEWQAGLKAGKATAKVAFTGGSITTQGVIPATFTTGDPIIQFVIEGSHEFKSGKIKVVRRVKIDGEVEIQRNPKVEPIHNAESPMHNENNPESAGVDATEEAGEQEAEVRADEDKPEEVEADDEQQPEAENANTPKDKALVDVEFACNDDAKDYLEQQFRVIRSKLHNRAEIIAVGKANGVNIIFS